MPNLSRSVRAVTAFAVLTAAGCGGDEGVSSYRAPKSADSTGREPPPRSPAAADGKEYRILGAMYPADDPVWFLKLTGPADLLASYEADFDKLAASVKLQGNATPTFTLPDGWRLGGGRNMVAETVKLPDGKLEVTVTTARGGVEGNVGRWAGQVGQAFAAGDAAKVTKPFDAAGGKGLRVDVRGPQNPSAGGMGPMMGGKR